MAPSDITSKYNTHNQPNETYMGYFCKKTYKNSSRQLHRH